MKGWKTILYAVITAAMAVIDQLTEIINVPDWYYLYIVPFVMFILRLVTDGPSGLTKILKNDSD